MNRKSVRVFEDKEISPEIKDIILAAAMRAPTGGNCMPYSIIDVTDQSIKDKLAETCDHQPFIAQAKMVLIFCADYHVGTESSKWRAAKAFPRRSSATWCLQRKMPSSPHTQPASPRKASASVPAISAYCGELRDSQRAFKPAPAGRAALHAGLRLSHPAAKGKKADNSFCKELHRV